MSNNFEPESPRYHKKKPSHTSKSASRSDHKHAYERIILIDFLGPRWNDRCTVCGRLKSVSFSRFTEGLSKPVNPTAPFAPCRDFYSAKELHEKFPDIQIYERKTAENGYTMWEDTDIELIYDKEETENE